MVEHGPTFMDTQQRVNDCVAQTYCDKRTLATLTNYFLDQRGYVLSLSELVRMSLELLEELIVKKDSSYNVVSTEDADEMLRKQYKANLNPMRKMKREGTVKPRYNYSFRKQLDLEDAFLEDRPPGYVRPKTLGNMMEKKAQDQAAPLSAETIAEGLRLFNKEQQKQEPRKYRKPDNLAEPETLEEATARRKHESAELKTALASMPGGAIVKEEDDAD